MEDRQVDNIPQNKHPIRVQVVDGSGNQITSFGGSGDVTISGEVEVKNDAGNPVPVSIAPGDSFDHGSNRDVDTVAEVLTATSYAAPKGVTVVADRDNTGIVYVGNSDVTAGTTAATDGFPLGAGESLTLEINNPNLIYVIGSANNQIVYWAAV